MLMRYTSIRVLPLLCLLVLAVPVSAMARVATALWYDKLPENVTFEVQPPMSKEAARQVAFGEAVYAEALELVRSEIPEERKVYLHDFLAARAAHFVVSYTELGVTDTSSGRQLSADVQVNRDALHEELRRLGLFVTLQAPLAYSPQYGTVQPETWEQLGRLHVLFGLTPNSDAPLELRMNFADKVWTITMHDRTGAADAAPYFGSAGTLEEAWFKVWGSYFGKQAGGVAQTASGVLSIDGWFTPDGVEAFDAMLQEWTDVLGSAVLEDVSMEAAGISGRWAVDVINGETLKTRLVEYTSKRRLSFALKEK